jgi:hypothetical protein
MRRALLPKTDCTYTAEISNSNLNGHSNTAFVTSRQIVGQPSDNSRERRIDGACCDEDTGVDDLGVVGRDTPGKVSMS